MILTAIVVAAVTAAPMPEAAAHTPTDTLKACYVRGSGTVYRTGVPNTPATCTSAAHIPFVWVVNSGNTGAPAAQSVSAVTVTGVGNAVGGSLAFIGPTATVDLAGSSLVHVSGHKALGTTFPTAHSLLLDVCYRASGGPLVATGQPLTGLQVDPGFRFPFSLTASFTLPAGTYDVGLCGYSLENAGAWNYNSQGRVTALVFPAP